MTAPVHRRFERNAAFGGSFPPVADGDATPTGSPRNPLKDSDYSDPVDV